MRQSWPHGQAILLGQHNLHFDMPANSNATEAYKDLTYQTQAVHAHCLTLSSAHFRMQRGSAAGTMGLMFWSLNNQWQGQSDAAVDYTGRWKLLQHAAARYFAPTLLHLHAGWDTQPNSGWADTNITAGVVNDTPRKGSATVTVTLRSWATGASLKSWRVTGDVPAFSSTNISKWHKPQLLDGRDENEVFLTATVAIDAAGGEPLPPPAPAHHFFNKIKHLKLVDPKLRLVFGSGRNLTVTVSCEAPAPFVFLDPGVLRGHFSDNGMLLLPSAPRTLTFDAAGEAVTAARLQAEVVARHPWGARHPA